MEKIKIKNSDHLFMQENFVLELNWIAAYNSYIQLDGKQTIKLFCKIN